MKIEHIAVWVNDLEQMRSFYQKYFGAVSNTKYCNVAKGFSSYFLCFESGARIELMHSEKIPASGDDPIEQSRGLIHFAFSTGSKERVDELTETFRRDNYTILDGPRYTGDGYYESVVLDPEDNRIEITI